MYGEAGNSMDAPQWNDSYVLQETKDIDQNSYNIHDRSFHLTNQDTVWYNWICAVWHLWTEGMSWWVAQSLVSSCIFIGSTCICHRLYIFCFSLFDSISREKPSRCDISLTMARLDVRASSLLTKASSCCMSAAGGSTRTGSRQDKVDSWTPWSGHDRASNSRDRSWTGTKTSH